MPNIDVHYDYDFDVQEFLQHQNSPLASLKINDQSPSTIIKHWCLRYNVNQKIILTRMEFEQNGITAKLSRGGKYWMYPDGSTATASWVLDRICGYGQIKDKPHFSKKYLGFEKQIAGCAHVTKKNFKRWGYLPYILNDYTPTEDGKGVTNFFKIFKRYWPKDLK